MKKICASCKTDRQVKFYDKGKTEFGTFNIGWNLCLDCYEREVSLEHDRHEDDYVESEDPHIPNIHEDQWS